MKPFVHPLLFAALATATPLNAAALDLRPLNATLTGCEATDKVAVRVQLDAQSALAFAAFTEDRIGQTIAVYLDGTLLTTVVIAAPVPGDVLQITGSFATLSAKAVTKRLNAGAAIRVTDED